MSSAIRALQSPSPRARPFLKWAGGKSKLVEQIVQRFPASFARYHEPFLGGGAVFFAVDPQRAMLSDINAELIDAYCALRDDVEGVIRALRRHAISEEHFYAVRSQARGLLNMPQSAARTIFLNRTCFNGLYRVNRAGQFNVPFGQYDKPRVCDEENLRAVSAVLKGVSIEHQSVFHIGRRAKKGDVVYFDPPYDPVSKTASFTAYTLQGFGRDEQAQLAQCFADLAARGVHCVLSNSDTPFIRELYRDFRVDTVFVRRAINSRADRRGPVSEVLVSTT